MITKYGLFTDTYTSLTGTGLMPGMVAASTNSPDLKMLVQNNSSGGTITAGEALMFTTGAATSYEVDAATGTGTPIIGVNDQAGTVHTGASIAAGTYFWMSYKGFAYPLVATGRSVNDLLGPSATAGTLDVRSTAMQSNIVLLAANSSGGALAKLCFIS